jgi:hypothetical protein
VIKLPLRLELLKQGITALQSLDWKRPCTYIQSAASPLPFSYGNYFPITCHMKKVASLPHLYIYYTIYAWLMSYHVIVHTMWILYYVIIGNWPADGTRHQEGLTDWPSVATRLWIKLYLWKVKVIWNAHFSFILINNNNSVALVRERTIPPERS